MNRYQSTVKGAKAARHIPLGKSPELYQRTPVQAGVKMTLTDTLTDTLTKGVKCNPSIGLVAAGPEIVGGHSVQARALIDNLKAEGYDIRFIPINPTFPRGVRWLRRFPYVRTLLNQLLFLPSLIVLKHVDVVHIFSASYWSFLLGPVPAILAGRLFGKRIVMHYHSGEAEDHLARWGILVHPWLRMVNEIVVPSVFLQWVFARHRYHVRVIQNVIDISSFQYRERTSLRPIILSTRNFEVHYRVDITIRAFSLILMLYPDAKLILAGAGSEESKLRRLAQWLPMDSVQFVGRIDPKQMPKLCNQSDIFVNASIIDNQPVSILEAFAAGLPVVSTAIGGIASMIRDGETGLLIRPGDPNAMAEALMKLLNNPSLAQKMASLAKQEVEHYTWPKVRDEWGALYQALQVPEKSTLIFDNNKANI